MQQDFIDLKATCREFEEDNIEVTSTSLTVGLTEYMDLETSEILNYETHDIQMPTKVKSVGNLRTSTPLSSGEMTDFEPIRRIGQAAPPKRFYRTFWRSVTRRIMDSAMSR